MSGEVFFRRFRRVVLRMWWLPVVCGLLLSALFGLRGRTNFSNSTAVNVVTNSAVLQTLDMKPDALSNSIPINVDASTVAGSDFQDEVQAKVGHVIDVVLTPSPVNITVGIQSDSAVATAAALQMYIDRIIASRTHRFQTLIDGLVADQKSIQIQLQARITDLDGQLAKVGDPASNLAGALIQDRAHLSTQIVQSLSISESLGKLRDKREAAYEVTPDGRFHRASDTMLKIIAGGSFGALLGIAVLLFLARSKRRIRDRYDVLLVGGLDTIDVLRRKPASQDLERAAHMLSVTTQGHGGKLAEIVGLELGPDAGAGAERLIAAMERIGAVSGRLTLDLDASPSLLASDGVFFIAVAYGSPTGPALHRIANDLARTGRKLGGALIVDVPERDFEQAAANPPGTPGLD